jgi:amino acid permease
MANMPQIIPGGRIDPTATGLSPEIAARIKKREDEAEIIRSELENKRDTLRKNLKVYDGIKNESQQWALRSELSERHVRMLAGEGVGGAAF